MTLNEVMKELESYGSEQTKKVFLNHGVKEPFYGVKVADLKKIVKKVKKDYKLSQELYNTGNSDAMYLAGLIADETQMTEKDLNSWVMGAYWYMISDYTVPWIAAESNFGWKLALEWIESDKEFIASAGWSTLSSIVSIREDDNIDLKVVEMLMKRVEKEIHTERNRVRYAMNGFIISVGVYVINLADKAIEIAGKIGKVDVKMGSTACKVPLAKDYIKKIHNKGLIGKKRKSARC